jgi:pimeloyl-ACP methyl ester carboxylesterase
VGVVVALAGLIVAGLILFTAWTAWRVEKRLPPRRRFIDVDGPRVHYLDEGTGPTLLLVHSLGGHMLSFTHSLLGKLTCRFRVIVLDRPGSGYSTRRKGASATIRAQARTIGRFCQELKLGRPLIVGHSLGGAIAPALALNHPEQVAGLALLAPATHRPEHVPDDFAVAGGGLLSLRPCSFIGASADLLGTSAELGEMPSQYEDLTVPVGILYGTGDRILDPAVHGKGLAAKVTGADLERIEGGGHMIPVTSADRVIEV